MTVEIPFPHRLAGHCASGAFRDLFEFRGYRHRGEPVSEAMVFGLGSGLDVLYLPNPTPRVPFYLGGRAPLLEESLLARVGGSLSRRAEPDSDAAWAYVQAKLDRGEPVAMVGDCQKLDYLKTRASMPLHVIVATGYDATHALIADNDRAQIQRCAHASLRAARAAQGFPLPAMNVTFEIAWPDALPPLAALVRPAIAQTATWLHDPGGLPAQIYGRDAFGLPALARLARDLEAWRTQPPAQPAAAAMLLWIAIEKGGTGGAFFRNLWRDFLAEAHALAPSPALARAHAHYRALADGWAEAGALAATGAFAKLLEPLARLVAAEREGAALLAAVSTEEEISP